MGKTCKKSSTPFSNASLSLIFFLIISCTVRPYIAGNIFDNLGVSPENENRCVVMISGEKIDYFLCEPQNKAYRIKIIPSEKNVAVLIVIPEQGLSDDYFANVIEKDIKQISVNVNYSPDLRDVIEGLKRGKREGLYVKSPGGERHQIEALFPVEEILEEKAGRRGGLR
ncbi:MAG: hypothetical protein N3B13_03565 [Deltaproteobacteria bacterium]|nr:hypothetical protein [Deltaproteobacteria bacterium]